MLDPEHAPSYRLPMTADVLSPPRPAKSPKTRPIRGKSMTQLLELQAEAHASGTDPDTPLSLRAAYMRAWCDLQEEKRKLQMRPLPKSIDVSKMQHGRGKRQNAAQFTEPEAKSDKESLSGPTVTAPRGGDGETTGQRFR